MILPREHRETHPTRSAQTKKAPCVRTTQASSQDSSRSLRTGTCLETPCVMVIPCLPDWPYLTAHTSLWDSEGCGEERTQHTSSWKGGVSATLLNVWRGWLGPSRTEPICRGHCGFLLECRNHWILCTEARVHLEQLPLNALTAKGQAPYMGSKERLLQTEQHWPHHSLSHP